MRLELAADYLVMAAWLAYLKSRLLLPEPPKGEEPSAEDLATALALRLRRLEAIREAAEAARRAQRGSAATCSPAARPSRWSIRKEVALGGDALRSALGLCPPAPEAVQQPRRPCTSGMSGRWSRPARRWSGWSARLQDWTVPRRYLVALHGRARRCGRPCSPRPSRRPSRWCARASSSCARTSAFAPLWVQGRDARARAGRQEPEWMHDGRSRRALSPRKIVGRCARPRPTTAKPAHRRGAAVRLAPSRSRAEELAGRLPEGADVRGDPRRPCRALCRCAASIWSRSPAAGPSAPPATSSFLLARDVGRAAQAVARRAGDARDRRLSPAGDAGRDRGDPRRRDLQGHARRRCWRPAGSGCAAAARRRAGP